MSNLRKFGTKTPRAKVYKSESHKLCQSFPVAADVIINEGEPVFINEAGEITNAKGIGAAFDPTTHTFIGISTSKSSDSPYPEKEQTVMVAGFAVIYGVAKGAMKAGPVVVTNEQTEEGYSIYENAPAPTGTTPQSVFIALHPVEDGELVQIMVMGNLIP